MIEHLEALAGDPDNEHARRAISKVATRKVGQRLCGALDERPDLAAIVEEILDEAGRSLSSDSRRRLQSTVRSIVNGVFDDDEPTGVTEALKDWGASGRVNEEELYSALLVALGKRIRYVLAKPQFGSLRHKVVPGQLLTELYLKLRQAGIPQVLENRFEFYAYAEAALKNLLVDMQRHGARKKRPQTRNKKAFEDLLRVVDEGGETSAQVHLDAEEFLDLLNAIDSLPSKLKLVFKYRFIWGLGIEEVVNRLEVSPATVKRRSQEALVILREKLAEIGGQGRV